MTCQMALGASYMRPRARAYYGCRLNITELVGGGAGKAREAFGIAPFVCIPTTLVFQVRMLRTDHAMTQGVICSTGLVLLSFYP
jgi:hypothetical protein